MKHTPGLWEASPLQGPYPICIVEHENDQLTWFVNASGPIREDPEGDARLIAAAPLMLRRLEAAEQTLRNLAFGFLDAEANTIAHNEAANIRAIISRARGEP